MKTGLFQKVITIVFLAGCSFFVFVACEPLATGFNNTEDAQYLEAGNKHATADTFSKIRVMTWNIRFGIGRRPWFGDACGNITVYAADSIFYTLDKIVGKINEIQPDILLLQEVDLSSKRSSYVDELRYILDHTYFNYAIYGFQWKAQFIPSDGLGKLEETNMILARWRITKAKRIQLQLRGDQDKLTRYFYERCCIVEGVVNIPNNPGIEILNIHVSAFATDDTKYKHFQRFKSEMDNIRDTSGYFIAGGDMNTLPPGSDSTDYCFEDMCPGESFHHPGDNPFHKEGSNYAPEEGWLSPFYTDYHPAILLADYQADQQKYFTHTTRPTHFWDRTLDYLFTNYFWVNRSVTVHQEAREESDHAPVSVLFYLPGAVK